MGERIKERVKGKSKRKEQKKKVKEWGWKMRKPEARCKILR